MNGRRLTDAQISQALRAHLPDRAQAGLRERILEAAETTAQQRALPSFLGALSEADPVARRRSLLIAAALLVALALASAAAVGALRLLQRDPIHGSEPRAAGRRPGVRPLELRAAAAAAARRLRRGTRATARPRAASTSIGRGRSDSNGSRQPRRPSPPATRSSAHHRISGMAPVGSETVWVEPGHEAIGDDPRVFIRPSSSRRRRAGLRDGAGSG